MNTRRVISSLIGAAVTIAAIWAYAHRAPVAPAAPAALVATKPAPVTPIVDNATIDFSSGKPTMTSSAADKAAIDAAVKQIDEATKSVTFPADTPAKK
ncbi:MAG TPA: hypothetical protein VIJ19_11825 [Opitutaceae bacterium]